MESDRDLNHVFNKLDLMKPGEIIIIKDHANKRYDTFISCAKQYADIYGTIQFNDNYTKIKKLHEWKQSTNEP